MRRTRPASFKHRPESVLRRGVVELEAVLITAVMFPLAVALFGLAVKGLRLLYDMAVTLLESPYL